MAEYLKNNNLVDLSVLGNYLLRSKLGESSVSTVWKAYHITTGEAVVLKQIHVAKLTRHLRNCLECEITFLSSVRHPNIIRLLDFFESGSYITLVFEFCEGGNLASYIRCHGRVQECIAITFMQQLGAGLKVMKQNNIIHRDLKPEVSFLFQAKRYNDHLSFLYRLLFSLLLVQNILLSGSERDPVLKIADFGLSRTLLPNEHAETVCGSPFYMAPEVLQFQRYDEKVDMWSVGAILFELLNGYPPFNGRTNVQLLKNIKGSASLPFSSLILPELHPECIDLCSRLLSINPDDRLSSEELYQHHLLRSEMASNIVQ